MLVLNTTQRFSVLVGIVIGEEFLHNVSVVLVVETLAHSKLPFNIAVAVAEESAEDMLASKYQLPSGQLLGFQLKYPPKFVPEVLVVETVCAAKISGISIGGIISLLRGNENLVILLPDNDSSFITNDPLSGFFIFVSSI